MTGPGKQHQPAQSAHFDAPASDVIDQSGRSVSWPPCGRIAPISKGIAHIHQMTNSGASRPLEWRMMCGESAPMNITRLTENGTAATVLAAPARPEADPDFVNELYAYGRSHVDAHH
jgi:hypothetical protein